MQGVMPRLLVSTVVFSLLASAQGLNTTASKDDWEEINFEFNSHILSDGYPSLLRLAEILGKNPEYKVQLSGHTDSVGAASYNEKLALRRADTVKAFLVKYGVRDAQVTTSGQGKRDPKVDNRSREGRFMNRRVSVSVTDGQGKIISAGGIGDAIKTLQQVCPDYSQNFNDILKRLDDIAKLLDGLKGENDRLRGDLDRMRGNQDATKAAVDALPRGATAAEMDQLVTKALEKERQPRFAILGANAGADQDGGLTFQGRARYFAPFREKFAVQAQGEYFYFRDRQEGQFDLGLVSRFHHRWQAGMFSSFKHVTLRGMQDGGTLGQGSFTMDYLFGRGRVGFFGSKSFLNNAVVNRHFISRNILEETYLRVVDQAGASGAVTIGRNSVIEGNIGWLGMRGGSDKPGGTVRFIQPVSDRFALTAEGGWNETLVATGKTYGRITGGVLFGNFMQPREYLSSDRPVPVDVPRVRYEMLTRRVRLGNDAPIADAGPDQTVSAGQVTLDGSASYDPDGDKISFEWTQVSGPSVGLSGKNTATATFTASEGQIYSFRLKVTDDQGLMSLARTTVTVKSSPSAVIQRFNATPASIQSGQSATLAWQVQNAESVEISGIGSVNPQSGTTQVSPTQTTTYKLTAKNAKGEVSETITVTVNNPNINIVSFTGNPASIRAGESATLAWQTENATGVTISGIGSVSPNGSTSVSPTQTTTYTLTATGPSGTLTKAVTITVGQETRIVSFAASPAEVAKAGDTARLTWQTTNATEVTISGVGPVAANGSVDVNPAANTVYVITARGPLNTDTRQVHVTVKGSGNGGGVNPGGAPVVALNVPDFFITYANDQFLDASQSYDPAGGKLTYQWRHIEADAARQVTIASPSSASTAVKLPPFEDDYIVEVKVTNEKGVSATKQVRMVLKRWQGGL